MSFLVQCGLLPSVRDIFSISYLFNSHQNLNHALCYNYFHKVTLLITFHIYYYQFDLMKVGVGMSMEGIEQNPIVYDLMSEMAFQHKKIDVKVK